MSSHIFFDDFFPTNLFLTSPMIFSPHPLPISQIPCVPASLSRNISHGRFPRASRESGERLKDGVERFPHETHPIRAPIASSSPRNSSEFSKTPWLRSKKIDSYVFLTCGIWNQVTWSSSIYAVRHINFILDPSHRPYFILSVTWNHAGHSG